MLKIGELGCDWELIGWNWYEYILGLGKIGNF